MIRLCIIVLAGLLTAVRPAAAIVFQSTTAQSAGLGAGQSFLNAEAKLVVTHSGGSHGGCSASLVTGGAYLITAAHCLTNGSGTPDATGISIGFDNAGLSMTATQYVVDPVWNGDVLNGGDLALIHLATPVSSITGYQLATGLDATGAVVTLVGYGNTGVGATGYQSGTFGTLYYGQNQYDGVYSDVPTAYALDFDKFGTSAFNVFGGGAVGSNEVMIAPGDSGGASLLFTGGAWQIVGVHDFIGCITVGCTPNSSFGQIGGDTSVYADAAWIESVLAPEPASVAVLVAGLAALGAIRRRTDHQGA